MYWVKNETELGLRTEGADNTDNAETWCEAKGVLSKAFNSTDTIITK